MALRLPLAFAVTVLAFGLCAPAQAATVSMPLNQQTPSGRGGLPSNHYTFSIQAGAGEANRLTVEQTDGQAIVRVIDTGAPPTAGDNCRAESADTVVCSGAEGIRSSLLSARIDLGDGHDELALTGMLAIVAAGEGDDRVTSGGWVGVDGGPGADVMRAGTYGSADYSGRRRGVSVTPDGVANDGEPGEGDDVGPNFGSIVGGAGDDELHRPEAGASSTLDGRGGHDRLFGSSRSDRLTGGDGDDSLLGASGDDELMPGPGADLVRGGEGRDTISYAGSWGVDVTLDGRRGDGEPGENDDIGPDVEGVIGTGGADRIVGSDASNALSGITGDDRLDGNGGPDLLHGGGGRDRLIGGSGADTINASTTRGSIEAQDGERDEIRCSFGSGNTFALDPFDSVVDCAGELLVDRVTVRRDGSVKLLVRCNNRGEGPCAGKLYAYRAGRPLESRHVIGRARFDVLFDGTRSSIEVPLVKSARRELARKSRLKVALVWRTSSASPPSTASGRLDTTLEARR